MNSAALEMAPAPVPMARWKRISLSIVLALLALYETWDASMFFQTLSVSENTGSGISGVLMKTFVFTHPIFAVAALGCALTGRVRYAVMALAGVVLGRCLWYLPGPNGNLASKDLYALQPTIMLLVAPALMAVAAFVLAKCNQLLGLATLLVSAPVIYSNYEIALFVLAVSIYGF